MRGIIVPFFTQDKRLQTFKKSLASVVSTKIQCSFDYMSLKLICIYSKKAKQLLHLQYAFSTN